MAERTDQRTRSVDDHDTQFDDLGVGSDVDTGSRADQPAETADATRTSRLRERLASPFSGLFSLRAFLFVLVLSVGAALFAGTVIPFGGLAGLLGIAGVGFGVGLVDSQARYLEFTLAGAIAAGLGTLLDHLVLAALGLGLPLVAVGVGAGSLAGVVGHYFGRDLRSGLTRDL